MLTEKYLHPLFGIRYEAPTDSGVGEIKTLIDNLGTKLDKQLPDEVIESLKNLAKRNNGGELDPVHKLLFNDNHSLRERARKLEEQTLGDGQVAVNKEKLDLITVLEENDLKSKEDVEKFIETSNEAKKKAQELEHKTKMNEVADLYGANAKVLSKLLDDSVDVEVAQVEENGEKKNIANVVDAKGNKTEFKKYVDENLAEFKPSLFNIEEEGNTGKQWTPQNNRKGSGNSGSKTVDDFIKNQRKSAETGNPLKPKREES